MLPIRLLAVLFCLLGLFVQRSAGAVVSANFNPPAGNSDYATGSNWDTGTVPGNDADSNDKAHIGWNTARTAVYSTATDVTTTGRLLIGLGTGNATLTMSGDAGTLTFGGDDFGNANYVGVDRGVGTLNVEAGTLTTTSGALRIGSNTATAVGTLTIGPDGTVNVGTGSNAPNLYLGAGGASNRGTATIDGGTLNVLGNASMNNAGGIGTLNVRGDSTVNIAKNLALEGSSAGSGLLYPTGVGTIHATVVNNQFNPIQVGGELKLNPSGASVLDLDVVDSGVLPGPFTLINYGTSDATEAFNFGGPIVSNQGHHFAIDYGSGSNDAITLSLQAFPKRQILLDVGPTGGRAENTIDGLVWNNVGQVLGNTVHSTLAESDGTLDTDLWFQANGVSGRDGNTTLNAGWGDADGVSQEVMNSWYHRGNGTMSITLGGFDPEGLFDIEVFNAFNTSANTSDIQINGFFADGSLASTSDMGDAWDRAADGWGRKQGLLFPMIQPDVDGQFLITFIGGNPTLQGLRITELTLVPEPSSIALAGFGILIMAAGVGRRRKTSLPG